MTTEEKFKSIKKILKTNLSNILIKRAFDLGYINEGEKQKMLAMRRTWIETENISHWFLYINILYSKVNKTR